MASECESGCADEDLDIRWHLNESTDADDTVLPSLEGAKLSEAQEQAKRNSSYRGRGLKRRWVEKTFCVMVISPL